MAPFIVLVGSFAILETLSLAGCLGAGVGWALPLRVALALMFLLTASAHWGKRRADLVRMVPRRLGDGGRWVTVTGVLELLGALGLVLPWRPIVAAAALGLSLLLLALFPANVHAARARLTLDGKPVTPLGRRTLLQGLFLGATVAVLLATLR
jgi:uncharacterized membrane protein